MDLESNKTQNNFKFHIGTKEFVWIVILMIFIVIAIKPDSFAMIIDKITNLANVPGFIDFVLAVTTKVIQKN